MIFPFIWRLIFRGADEMPFSYRYIEEGTGDYEEPYDYLIESRQYRRFWI